MKNTKITNTNSSFSNLPEDLIMEILLRLPVKTLLHFKTICKNWYTLITKNPNFARTQFQLSKQQFQLPSPYLLFKYDSILSLHLDRNNAIEFSPEQIRPQSVPISSKFIKMRGNYELLSSCNGIMCIHLRPDKLLCLWNPTIDEVRFIEIPFKGLFAGIIFSGFGYAQSINDYKIVLVISDKSRLHKSIIVYSLRRNEWRELDFKYYSSTTPEILKEVCCCTNDEGSPIRKEGVILNDALHWVMGCRGDKYMQFFILKFDLVNEYFEKVVDLNKLGGLDDDDEEEIAVRQTEIGVTDNNTLGIYQLYTEFNPSVNGLWWMKRDIVEVREMKDANDYNSWKTKYKFIGRWDDLRSNHDMIRITGNGNFVIIGNKGGEGMVIRHTRMNKDRLFYRNHRVDFYAAHYIPSLVNPNNF